MINWDATAAWIALAVAIIAPSITTLINNRFQLKLKRLELNFSKQSDYYEKQRLCVENFLIYASKQIDTNYESERIEFRKSFHELLLYIPNEDWNSIKELYGLILSKNPTAKEKLYSVTEILALQLQESSQKFPL